MRTDQYAYQQATRVSGIGLIAQLAIGLVLLVVGRVAGSTAFEYASYFAFLGVGVWATLAALFHQHRLAALEAAEAEELQSERGDASVFERERADDAMVAARRLHRMYQILVPVISLAVAGGLVAAGLFTVRYIGKLDDPTADAAPFTVGGISGWQLALCVALSLVTFIFSRFVAGMAKQPIWQNLRGGAGYMVGTALVLSAVGVGLVADVFGSPKVLQNIVLAIGIAEIAFAGEIVLNFVLALYRPRRANETPRAAFDSRVLSLFAAPDSIVRSINEAVNYQFGFDITSSWGYQLLLHSVAWLVGLGAVVLVLLSCIVIVPPGQQAVRLRGGAIVGDVAEGTMLVKWPWPFETVAIHDVARIRTLVLGSKPMRVGAVNLWGQSTDTDSNRFPYLVAAPALSDQAKDSLSGRGARPAAAPGSATGAVDAGGGGDAAALAVSQQFALVDADILLNYRIKPAGLLEWLAFANDSRLRRSASDMRERTLRDMALREVTQYLSTQPLSDVLSPRGDSLVRALVERIQRSFDAARSGVEVVAVQVPALRPPNGEGQGMFEEISIRIQNARKIREEAERQSSTAMAMLVGGPERATEVVAAIDELKRLERAGDADAPAAREQRAKVEGLIVSSRGQAASVVSAARSRRWAIVMGSASDAAEVLGQAPAYHAAPELYKQFRTMQVLGRALFSVRVKYVLGESIAGRTDLGVTMKQAESGLNLSDYVENKNAPAAGGGR